MGFPAYTVGISEDLLDARSLMKVYLLSEAANPPEETFVNFSGMQMNTIHANDVTFYDELNAVVQNEPAEAFDPEIAGLFASIGIRHEASHNTTTSSSKHRMRSDDVQIPRLQRRAPSPTLPELAERSPNRDAAIVAAHATGAYSYTEIGAFFGLHFATIGKIVRKASQTGQRS